MLLGRQHHDGVCNTTPITTIIQTTGLLLINKSSRAERIELCMHSIMGVIVVKSNSIFTFIFKKN